MDYLFVTSEGVLRRDELKIAADAEGEAAITEARKKGTLVKCFVVSRFASKHVLY